MSLDHEVAEFCAVYGQRPKSWVEMCWYTHPADWERLVHAYYREGVGMGEVFEAIEDFGELRIRDELTKPLAESDPIHLYALLQESMRRKAQRHLVNSVCVRMAEDAERDEWLLPEPDLEVEP